MGDDAAVLQLQTGLERAKVQAKVAISRNALHNRGFILLATNGHYGFNSPHRSGFTTAKGYARLLLAASRNKAVQVTQLAFEEVMLNDLVSSLFFLDPRKVCALSCCCACRATVVCVLRCSAQLFVAAVHIELQLLLCMLSCCCCCAS